jgi:hypothetical protein
MLISAGFHLVIPLGASMMITFCGSFFMNCPILTAAEDQAAYSHHIAPFIHSYLIVAAHSHTEHSK